MAHSRHGIHQMQKMKMVDHFSMAKEKHYLVSGPQGIFTAKPMLQVIESIWQMGRVLTMVGKEWFRMDACPLMWGTQVADARWCLDQRLGSWHEKRLTAVVFLCCCHSVRAEGCYCCCCHQRSDCDAADCSSVWDEFLANQQPLGLIWLPWQSSGLQQHWQASHDLHRSKMASTQSLLHGCEAQQPRWHSNWHIQINLFAHLGLHPLQKRRMQTNYILAKNLREWALW